MKSNDVLMAFYKFSIISIMMVPFLILSFVPAAISNPQKMDIQSLNLLKVKKTNSCIGCNLDGANFDRMELKNVDFSGANLDGASFFLTILKGASFRNASLINAKFIGADFSCADFRGANVEKTIFTAVYKRDALFDFVKGTLLEDYAEKCDKDINALAESNSKMLGIKAEDKKKLDGIEVVKKVPGPHLKKIKKINPVNIKN